MSPSKSNQFIDMTTRIINDNMHDEHFGVSELASKMGISRTVLYRKVKMFTNKSVSRYICEQRLHKASQLLQQHNLNVSEIAYRVGFGSPSYFIKCFHDYYGFPPGEFNRNNSQKMDILMSKKRLNRPVQYNTIFKLTFIILLIILILIIILALF